MQTPNTSSPEDWQRFFAASCNNLAWDIAERQQRSAADDRAMLLAAFASAYHWSQIGNPLNDARADITLAHVLSLLGQGGLARQHAQRALDGFTAHTGEDLDAAFAHLELAFAAAVQGDTAAHRAYYQLAQSLGNAISVQEDREVFQAELARIPQP